ncbi:hypothetical protein HPB48_004092 [Haemaphysalis longicornis]|uniref:Serine carboxypeptidase n=1 Tax=Haemaphysalis longicornis TaxID=44386 RepID=A0A9J6FLF6_HAELO|nr:hypothetical protein HPB48_004092 [Haemaphysalis longicornis]
MSGRRWVWLVLTAVLLVLCIALIGAFAVPRKSTGQGGDEDTLYLSPYVEKQEVKEARSRSVVPMFSPPDLGSEAHAGLITVNAMLDSHPLLPSHPSQERSVPSHAESQVKFHRNHLEAPLLLWLQGGPGSSSLFGQFLENGPLAIDAHGKVHPREHTMREYLNVIYLDQPVGAGFSRTGSPDGYPTTLEELSRDIHRFLEQFFELFPEYKDRDFYVAGESYGARAAVALAIRLHENPDLPVKLRGVSCGVGFLGPLLPMLDQSDYFHKLGVLDYQGWQIYKKRMADVQDLVTANRSIDALGLLLKTVFVNTDPNKEPTLFQRLSGYAFDGNVLRSVEPAEFGAYREHVASADFKQAVHVGRNAEFRRDAQINVKLAFDYFRNISDIVSTLMDNYRFLAYTGQLDPVLAVNPIEDFLRDLDWSRAGQFRHAHRAPWFAGGREEGISGYVTTAGDFSFVVLASAGHYPGFDQTRAVDNLMRRFVAGNLTQLH